MIFGILNIVVFFNQLGDFFFFLHVASVYVLIMLRKKRHHSIAAV